MESAQHLLCLRSMTSSISSRSHLQHLIDENEQLRRQVAELTGYRDLAYRDPLTGLWTRRYAEERAQEEIARAVRSSRSVFSLVLVRIRGLQTIAHVLGHAAGEQSVAWCGRFLLGAARGEDVCCRVGADEFLVLLPGADAPRCAGAVARLRGALEEAQETHPHATRLSFGAATWSADASTLAELLELAARRMARDERLQAVPPAAGGVAA